MKDYIGYIIIVLLGLSLMFLSITSISRSRDLQCKAKYGQDYSYTSRFATDCIDSNGNGKFLKH